MPSNGTTHQRQKHCWHSCHAGWPVGRDLHICPSSLPSWPKLFRKYYDELRTVLDERYAYSPKITCGDFNARIIKALPSETSVVGPFTFGAHSHDIDYLSDAQFDNRSRLLEFCLEWDFVIKNTFFQKTQEQLITYRAVGVSTWEEPFNFNEYAQLDYILINSPWKNAIRNINSTYIHTLETDHKLLIADVEFRLKIRKKSSRTAPARFHKPTEAHLNSYNNQIRSKISELQHDFNDNEDLTLDHFNDTIHTAALALLPRRHPKQKQTIFLKLRGNWWNEGGPRWKRFEPWHCNVG